VRAGISSADPILSHPSLKAPPPAHAPASASRTADAPLPPASIRKTASAPSESRESGRCRRASDPARRARPRSDRGVLRWILRSDEQQRARVSKKTSLLLGAVNSTLRRAAIKRSGVRKRTVSSHRRDFRRARPKKNPAVDPCTGNSPVIHRFSTASTVRGESGDGIRPALHPRELRCSSLKYSRYSRSSRLARGAHRRPRCSPPLPPRTVDLHPRAHYA
jgi:hypothetical protein